MRGAVHRIRADHHARGHEQGGRRFAVVLQATRFDLLSRWVVAPTSTGARSMVVRPEVDWGDGPTLVLCDSLVSVDPAIRLGDQVGHLTLADLRAVDVALALLLDLSPPPSF
ncbi:type II toxin-antitoxin system PemK/MazF family toxin [Klenkia sp. PcliD-1-E]|uniref:type II toxin-antitoxin system PemK/MazF family toxin n=1 Tax=Klenkia sp. PcliD-1-E TaxID=2954492 RepID=UPI0020982597|nr:type II toxin-antitoxin system PemK/MazF family toxin [Klenkia sp. PcliD-1-E]MCO7219045.1 type II toxin-antitoxin system PemK/MazF family toxin [Klenkia sp. PcliD-1-E]